MSDNAMGSLVHVSANITQCVQERAKFYKATLTKRYVSGNVKISKVRPSYNACLDWLSGQDITN